VCSIRREELDVKKETYIWWPNWIQGGHELYQLSGELMPHDGSLAIGTFCHLIRECFVKY